MKKLSLFAAVLLSAVFIQSCNETLINEPVSEELSLKSADVKKSYIVVLKDTELETELAAIKGYEAKQEKAKSAAEKIMKRAGITEGELGQVYGSAIKGFSVKVAPGQLKKLQDDPSVSYIEEDIVYTFVQPDVKINAKPGRGTQPAESIPWGITRVKGGISGVGKVAWIIDSGIDLDHPDLNVDVARSRDFSGSGTPDDANGHGTHVAGTVAAIDNTIGVVGVAAGATVVSCRVLNRRGTGDFAWTIAALDYVATTGVGKAGDAINMSLGPQSRYTLQSLDDAVKNTAAKGILIAMAAGNSSDDALYYSPARTNGTGIYTISAMDNLNKFASFSNYGSPVDYCEPGVSVYSCYKGGAYATMSGTSMASPHFCGLLLLGSIRTDGNVSGDTDGKVDPIGVH